jgi:hypothetical protein
MVAFRRSSYQRLGIRTLQANPQVPQDFQPESLLPFTGNFSQPTTHGLAFNLIDYIELVDWTGRAIRDDKRGAIAANAPPILQRLDISSEH